MGPRRGHFYRLSTLTVHILRRISELQSIAEERNVPVTEVLDRLIAEWAELHMPPDELATMKERIEALLVPVNPPKNPA